MKPDVEVIDARRETIWNENDGGRWITFCRRHQFFIQHEARDVARSWKNHPDEWCEGCQEENE